MEKPLNYKKNHLSVRDKIRLVYGIIKTAPLVTHSAICLHIHELCHLVGTATQGLAGSRKGKLFI